MGAAPFNPTGTNKESSKWKVHRSLIDKKIPTTEGREASFHSSLPKGN